LLQGPPLAKLGRFREYLIKAKGLGSEERVSNAKAKRVLGWAPRYPSFREGLRATVAALHPR
jgi:nucleoside-diphosphate-sugar epimerase